MTDASERRWDLAPPIELSGILITLVDPRPGFEAAHNDWYERDHVYAGGTAVEGVISGRRWYASREHRDARLATDGSPFPDPRAGWHLATYFLLPGAIESYQATNVERVTLLESAGRMFPERDIRAGLYGAFLGSFTNGTSMAPHTALNYPFGSVLLSLGKAVGAEDPSAAGELPVGSIALSFRLAVPIVLSSDPSVAPAAPLEDDDRFVVTFLRDNPPTESAVIGDLVRSATRAAGVSPVWGAVFAPILPGETAFLSTL